ncbi:hypothetical protein [Halorubrum rubrum]|uniref:hypothetical protein n=1 Tax=Halorubrum rubrum TaxID=1126240 RepID=UPI0021120DFE|nr:hypothetical protein [Halorubrum rubrum]
MDGENARRTLISRVYPSVTSRVHHYAIGTRLTIGITITATIDVDRSALPSYPEL